LATSADKDDCVSPGSISQLGGVPGPHAQKPVSHSELEAFYQKFAPDSNGKRHSVADILKTYKHNRDGLNVALQQRYGRSLKDLEQAPHPKPPAQRPPVQKYPAEKSLKAPAARPPMVPARPTTSPALPKTSPVRPEKAPVAAATPPKEQYNPERYVCTRVVHQQTDGVPRCFRGQMILAIIRRVLVILSCIWPSVPQLKHTRIAQVHVRVDDVHVCTD
jgi:hypothetical protein